MVSSAGCGGPAETTVPEGEEPEGLLGRQV